jgi:hypothetical protein
MAAQCRWATAAAVLVPLGWAAALMAQAVALR